MPKLTKKAIRYARGSSLPSRGATKASSTPSGGSRASAPARGSSKAAAKQDKQVEGKPR